MEDSLVTAEMLLSTGDAEPACELLERLAADAEEYVSRNCPTTDELQWFSFPTIFERLAYRRVERDPRELRDVGEPLDRLYTDLAHALVMCGDYAAATEALKQAVRWDPMGCGARLDLAELYRTNGQLDEFLSLSFSVFERASDARHLARAFANFGRHYLDTGQDSLAAAALRCARRLEMADPVLDDLLARVKGTPADPDSLTDEQAQELLGNEGLPDGANAEIALTLLMCATDAAQAGQRNLATTLTVRARDLVGAPAVKALLELIRDADGGETRGGAASAAAPATASEDGGETHAGA